MMSVLPCARAAEAVIDFHIPAGELATVLDAIGVASGRPIAFPAELATSLRSGPVDGRLTARAAAERALAGSGLTLVGGQSGPLTIRRNQTSAAGAGGAALDIADIDVSGGGGSPAHDDGFQAGDAGGTLRIADLPIKESALNVSAVTQDVIRSQNDVDAFQTLQNVAGVTLTGPNSYSIRGFQAGAPFVNGEGQTPFSTVPIDDIERVEVLKGPTSVFTGVSQPGGAVNITTKAPTDQTIRDATVRLGSYGYKTLAFDFGGLIPNTEGLSYRFNIAGNTADRNYAGYLHPHDFLISPALKWQDADTSVTAGIRYNDVRSLPTAYSFIPIGAPVAGDQILRLPRNVPVGNPDTAQKNTSTTLYTDQSRHLGAFHGIDVSFENHLNYEINTGVQNSNIFGGDYNYPLYDYSPTGGPFDYHQFVEQPSFTLKYNAGFFQQTSKVGFDYSDNKLKTNQFVGPFYGTFDGTGTLTDGQNMFNGMPFHVFANQSNAVSNIFDSASLWTSGGYFLDKIDTFDGRLHIQGQVRDDHFYSTSNAFISSGPVLPTTESQASSYGISWFGGGAFDATPWMTVYGNRSNGFVNQTGLTASGGAVGPSHYDQSEVGARYFFFAKRLTLTTSFYDLAQTNLAIADPSNPQFFIAIGGQRSRGFEAEVQGEVLPGLNVIGSFSDVRSQYQSPLANSVLQGAPQYTASVFTTYTVQEGPLRGVSFGGGAHGNVSSLSGGLGTDFSTSVYKIPGYVVGDLVAGYTREAFDLNLKISNIANRYYFQPSYFFTAIPLAEGRSVLLTSRYHF